eukprot:UN01298
MVPQAEIPIPMTTPTNTYALIPNQPNAFYVPTFPNPQKYNTSNQIGHSGQPPLYSSQQSASASHLVQTTAITITTTISIRCS